MDTATQAFRGQKLWTEMQTFRVAPLVNSFGVGVVQSTSSGLLYSLPLRGTQIDSALTYIPYNSTNPSGYISANQTITFTPTGDVTGAASGATSLTPLLTIGTNVVTYAKIQQEAANTLLGNASGSMANTAPVAINNTLWFLGGNTLGVDTFNIATTYALDSIRAIPDTLRLNNVGGGVSAIHALYVTTSPNALNSKNIVKLGGLNITSPSDSSIDFSATLQTVMAQSSTLTRTSDIEYPYQVDSSFGINLGLTSSAWNYGSMFLGYQNSNIGIVSRNGVFAGTNTITTNNYSNVQENNWSSGLSFEVRYTHNGNFYVYDSVGNITIIDSLDASGHYHILFPKLANSNASYVMQLDANGEVHSVAVPGSGIGTGFVDTVIIVTANYTALTNYRFTTIKVNATTATVTLPAPTTIGLHFFVRPQTSGQTVTVATVSGTIEGSLGTFSSTATITGIPFQGWVSDGSNWILSTP
jgi:hypothetical protein